MNNYKIKYIFKKNKLRKIITYNDDRLREEHRIIADKINGCFEPSVFSKGYIKGQSIYTNAISHLYNNYFIKTDIKDFFPSLNHNVLRNCIYNELKDIISPKDCELLIKKCSISNKGLPLGLITSPVLSNIYMKKFDIALYKKLKKLSCNNIIYTRYADDIIISFKSCSNPFFMYKSIIKTIESLLNDINLKLNVKKTKFIKFNITKQVKVTGVSIVEKNNQRRLSVGRNNKREFFYEVLNIKKSANKDLKKIKQLKGKMSFYLSIEKTGFDDFLSINMRKELTEFGYNSIKELVDSL